VGMAHPAQLNWEAARATEWENAMVSSNEIRNDLFISFPKTTPKLLSTGRTNSAALSFQYVRVLRRVILDTPAYFPYQMSAQKAIWASKRSARHPSLGTEEHFRYGSLPEAEYPTYVSFHDRMDDLSEGPQGELILHGILNHRGTVLTPETMGVNPPPVRPADLLVDELMRRVPVCDPGLPAKGKTHRRRR
jgi:hypothetical protein